MAWATGATPTLAYTLAFTVGDRGCFPTINTGSFQGTAAAGTGTGQTYTAASGSTAATATAMVMTNSAASGTAAGQSAILNDYFLVQQSLCQTFGSCCYTSNCNGVGKIVANFVFLIFSLIIASFI